MIYLAIILCTPALFLLSGLLIAIGLDVFETIKHSDTMQVYRNTDDLAVFISDEKND